MVFKGIAFICNICIVMCEVFNTINNCQKSVIELLLTCELCWHHVYQVLELNCEIVS